MTYPPPQLPLKIRSLSFRRSLHLLYPGLVHEFNLATPALPTGVQPLPLAEGRPIARLEFIGSERRHSYGQNPPLAFRWPKGRPVGSYRKTQLACTHVSQTLWERSSEGPARIKTSRPQSSYWLARPIAAPFTVVPPSPEAPHSFRTITSPIGAGPGTQTVSQDSLPLTGDLQ